MTKQRGASMADYVKAAFLFRWNLLFFFGAAAAAAISPIPDIALPLVGAAELAYLAGLSSVRRFRSAIDAKVHAQRTGRSGKARSKPQVRVSELVSGLVPKSAQRFQRLRARCVDMGKLAHGVLGQTNPDSSRADEIRTPALDRLLWVFLRLLYSQQALNRFLDTTDENQIQRRLQDLTTREAKASQGGDERIQRSLKDSIATASLRLENYQKAQANAEFVGIELDRIEGKIQALTEMAVSHQDPDYISSQVDSVAQSMTHTEEAIRELNQITGLSDDIDEPPSILDSDLSEALERG